MALEEWQFVSTGSECGAHTRWKEAIVCVRGGCGKGVGCGCMMTEVPLPLQWGKPNGCRTEGRLCLGTQTVMRKALLVSISKPNNTCTVWGSHTNNQKRVPAFIDGEKPAPKARGESTNGVSPCVATVWAFDFSALSRSRAHVSQLPHRAPPRPPNSAVPPQRRHTTAVWRRAGTTRCYGGGWGVTYTAKAKVAGGQCVSACER